MGRENDIGSYGLLHESQCREESLDCSKLKVRQGISGVVGLHSRRGWRTVDLDETEVFNPFKHHFMYLITGNKQYIQRDELPCLDSIEKKTEVSMLRHLHMTCHVSGLWTMWQIIRVNECLVSLTHVRDAWMAGILWHKAGLELSPRVGLMRK